MSVSLKQTFLVVSQRSAAFLTSVSVKPNATSCVCSIQVRGQENGLDGAKAGFAGRGAERGRRGRGRGRGTVGKRLHFFSDELTGVENYGHASDGVECFCLFGLFLFS